ncbi:MAG: TetR/AcrR family transcriptional regulator [Actinobacteria bacterium]|nr:TetR/AcrR family transcriptional regulator [Actinomycetota bacterium]
MTPHAKVTRRRVGRPPGGDSTETRDRVLRAAVKLFAEKGYHGTGVAEIGDAAGLQRGALYYHIGSKEDLLLVLLRRHVEESLEGEERIAAMDVGPAEKLRLLLRHHVKTLTERGAEASIWLRDASVLTGKRARELQGLRDRVEEIWQSVVREGEDAGVFRKSDPVVVLGLLSFANFVFLWYRPQGRLTPDQIADAYADLLLQGLLKPGP